MNKYFFIFLILSAFALSSCHFTEKLIINPDGSGTIELDTDLSEMMSLMEGMSEDSTPVKSEKEILIKDFIHQNKDSISKLSKVQQERLKGIENFRIQQISDPARKIMKSLVKLNFKNVSEANNILIAADEAQHFFSPKVEDEPAENGNEDFIGVEYMFARNKFTRRGYIKDAAKHKVQLDSLKNIEGFFATSTYKLHYTFPNEISSFSNPQAKIAKNKNSIQLQVPLLDYLRDPEVLNLEVTLK